MYSIKLFLCPQYYAYMFVPFIVLIRSRISKTSVISSSRPSLGWVPHRHVRVDIAVDAQTLLPSGGQLTCRSGHKIIMSFCWPP